MIAKLEGKQHKTNEEFFVDFLRVFQEFGKLNKEIWFFPNPRTKPNLLLFGEIGNGKSTFGNAIAKLQFSLDKKKKQKFKPELGFVSGKSSKAVTTKSRTRNSKSCT